MIRSFRAMLASEEGASLIEYALVLVLIAVVAIGVIKYFGLVTANTLGSVANDT